MKWVSLIIKAVEMAERLYAIYKQKQQKKATKKIINDPSGAWANQFGRVQITSNNNTP